jgi:tetratricopeptide (TPR) repeat protein
MQLDSALTTIDNSNYNNNIIKNILRAKVFDASNQFKTAATFYKRAYKEMSDKTDSLAWNTLLSIIVANSRYANHKDNKAFISEANSILAKKYNAGYKADLLNIESIIYSKLCLIDIAHNKIDSAIAINKRLNRHVNLSTNYTTKANIYFRKRDFNSALIFFRKAYSKGINEKSKIKLIRNKINIAAAADMCGEINESLDIYHNLLTDSISKNITPDLKSALYNNISGMYQKLVKYDSAILYIDSAINIASGRSNFRTLQIAYEQKSKLYRFKNDYRKAYRYNRISNLYKDSLNTNQLIKTIAGIELNNRYLTSEQKKRESEMAKHTIRRLNIIYIIAIAVIITISIIVIMLLVYKNKLRVSIFNRSLISLKRKHTDYINIYDNISRLNKTIELLKKDMGRAVFILQENIDLYDKIDKTLSKETDVPKSIKDIGTSVKVMQTMVKESDIISNNLDDNDIDLRIRIKQLFPQLTKNDIKLCILIRNELSTKEIALYTNIAAGSVEVAKYRLRKKLGFDNHAEMLDKLMVI